MLLTFVFFCIRINKCLYFIFVSSSFSCIKSLLNVPYHDWAPNKEEIHTNQQTGRSSGGMFLVSWACRTVSEWAEAVLSVFLKRVSERCRNSLLVTLSVCDADFILTCRLLCNTVQGLSSPLQSPKDSPDGSHDIPRSDGMNSSGSSDLFSFRHLMDWDFFPF